MNELLKHCGGGGEISKSNHRTSCLPTDNSEYDIIAKRRMLFLQFDFFVYLNTCYET